VQVLLLDLFPRGPFWDVWEKAFTAGPGKPKVRARAPGARGAARCLRRGAGRHAGRSELG
jgi:hypothetical protein